ncbi:MAG: hypothetical protein UHY68_03180, partial [Acutalibacteraceae bacterium]|nr:hypothetical protein [Acutalibacteraceae bacterium]
RAVANEDLPPSERQYTGVYWLQRWLAAAQSVGITKSELFNQYYYDEFISVMDEYNDMHTLEKDKQEAVYADEF